MKRRDFLTASAALASAAFPRTALLDDACSRTGNACLDSANHSPSAAEADWERRIRAPGVVWFHDFRNEHEVDAFRWLNGHGNDPDCVAPRSDRIRRITTDGIAGGACLEIWHERDENVQGWWRPFSPLKGGWPGNGKDEDDPGATDERHIEPRPWDPTAKPAGAITPKHSFGYYGHASYHAQYPGQFDGTEYYLQIRVKVDPNRLKYANGGKLLYLTRTDRSATDQEIVTVSGHYAGGRNVFTMYRTLGIGLRRDSPGRGSQPGSEMRGRFGGVCDFDALSTRACWAFSGGWDTLLYHVKPGLHNNRDTLVQVWAAHQGETSYTKIWDQSNVNLPFGSRHPPGHNALICSGYLNRIDTGPGIYHRFTQIIFSLDWIPCPQV